MEKELLSQFLPSGLLDHFTIIDFQLLGDVQLKQLYFKIELEEKNELLGYDKTQYESKGFIEVTLQDFPIRGKAVYLKIRRRRWRHKERPEEIVKNDFSYLTEGGGFTKELSDFLKGTGGYQRRHH